MKSTVIAVVLICAITALAFIGISAYSDSESSTLQLFVTTMGPLVSIIVLVSKQDKTLTVSESTDKKVDDRFDALEDRVGNMEKSLSKILSKLP